jgi:putative tryptophan/tyrosine transport system substrate-binding protein
MRRREFITLLGSAAAVPPLMARAQQKVWKIGFLTAVSRQSYSSLYAAFVKGMREFGHVEGKDFIVEWRSAEEHYERYSGLIAELIGLKVDVIVTASSPAYRALQRATDTIPIVIVYLTDPVGSGFVASLNHPGGNITGLASSLDEIASKQIELLSMVVPNMARVGLLGNPGSVSYLSVRKYVEAAAAKARLSLTVVEASNIEQIGGAFDTFKTASVQGFIAAGDPIFFGERNRLVQLAVSNRLPSMFPNREYTVAGGLMSYGESLTDFFYRAAYFVDQIFKGAKPGDLPIQQPTLFHLVINRTTAKTLDLTVPLQLYEFADEVIE